VPSVAEGEQHPQLAVYQIAVREGGFTDLTGERPQLGGAELVFLRKEMSGGLPGRRTQPALPAERPTWADALLDRTRGRHPGRGVPGAAQRRLRHLRVPHVVPCPGRR